MTRRSPPDLSAAEPPPAVGLTVADVAHRYRVGGDKVRAWIRSGELAAVNTASSLCGKPRYVVMPEALADFERRRAAAHLLQPVRRRKRTVRIDYYPD
jgi:hypothetical protein